MKGDRIVKYYLKFIISKWFYELNEFREEQVEVAGII